MTATQGAASNSVLEHFIQCQVQLDTISQSDHVRLEWKDTLGNNIESNIGVSLHSAVNAEDIVLTAVFDTLTAKQGTEYFCTATLNMPDTVSPLSQTVGITLELPDGKQIIAVIHYCYSTRMKKLAKFFFPSLYLLFF